MTVDALGVTVSRAQFEHVLADVGDRLQDSLVRIDARSMLVRDTITANHTVHVVDDWQMVVDGPYTVDGIVLVTGKLKVVAL